MAGGVGNTREISRGLDQHVCSVVGLLLKQVEKSPPKLHSAHTGG